MAAWPPAYGPRRRPGLLPMAERMLRAALDATAAANERRHQLQAEAPPGAPYPGALYPGPASSRSVPVTPVPPAASVAPAASVTPPAVAITPDAPLLERRLVRTGMTAHRAAALVAAAVARRGGPQSTGDLAADLRAIITQALPAPSPLPVEQGTIVIVGAGGSGKTHSVASLAAAQARAGHAVSVASHGTPLHEDELGELLHGESVNVIPAMRTRATARAIASSRARGLVVVDTASTSPGDAEAIDRLAEAVGLFEPDAVLLAVPATLSPAAALTLVDAFSTVDLTAILATRLDEVDGLGVVVELSMQTGLPLALTHSGLDLQHAIGSADAVSIVSSLL
jgi:hypothetical protein